MTKKITIHNHDKSNLARIFNSTLELFQKLEPMITSAHRYSSQLFYLEYLVNEALASGQKKESIVQFAGSFTQVLIGVCKLTENLQNNETIHSGTKQYEFTGEDVGAEIKYARINSAFQISTILRQPAALQFLASINPALPLRNKASNPYTFTSDYFAFLQAYWGGKAFEPLLLQNYKSTDPKLYDDEWVSDYGAFIVAPELDVWAAFLKNDQKLFALRLEQALLSHKEFWGRESSYLDFDLRICDQADGLTSLRLTALAAMAYDKGWGLMIESDYTPEFLVKGDFPRKELLF